MSHRRAAPRRAAACAAALGAAALAAACAPAEGGLLGDVSDGSVTVGTTLDVPGLAGRDPGGRLDGLDIALAEEVLKRVADQLGEEEPQITWQPLAATDRDNALRGGEIDVITGAFAPDAAANPAVALAGPYLEAQPAYLGRAGELSGPADAAGETWCVVAGSPEVAEVVSGPRPGRVLELASTRDCVESVRRGTVALVVADAARLSGFERLAPESLETGRFDGTKPVAYGLAVPAGDDDAKAALDRALREIEADGTLSRLVAEHLPGAEGVSAAAPGEE